jgi:hypothetical protein
VGYIILCVIPENFKISDHFEDRYFKEVEPEDIVHTKSELIRIVDELKIIGFYNGEELEFPPCILENIFQEEGLIFKQFQNGYGIDLLNINCIINELLDKFVNQE